MILPATLKYGNFTYNGIYFSTFSLKVIYGVSLLIKGHFAPCYEGTYS